MTNPSNEWLCANNRSKSREKLWYNLFGTRLGMIFVKKYYCSSHLLKKFTLDEKSFMKYI